MDTIKKGTITELYCELDFTKLGYVVSQPITPCRYDFIVDLDAGSYLFFLMNPNKSIAFTLPKASPTKR